MTSGSDKLEPHTASDEAPVNLVGHSPSALVEFFAGLGEKTVSGTPGFAMDTSAQRRVV